MAPHATTGEGRRRSSSQAKPTTHKFPDYDEQQEVEDGDQFEETSRGPSPRPLPTGLPTGLHSSERWPMRRESKIAWGNGTGPTGKTRHSRQKSLSEAINTVRMRKMSISENAHEIADSLKAPVSMKLIVLCCFWYGSSIMSNASSKAILTALPKPITLTIVQFSLVTMWCFGLSWLAKHNAAVRNALPVLKNGIRRPNRDIIRATLPLTAFQIGGHILNSDSMSRIPVSLVHTIKGLSPLMTVLAYRTFFSIRYSMPTYLSLIPLTLGVIMACSASFKGNFLGLSYAFGSAILFVTQNIVSKQIFNDAAKAEADGTPVSRRKPDKLNLLCYSSALALLFTFPLWLWSEGFAIAADFVHDGSIDLRSKPGSLDHGRLALEFLFNGTFHFGQSLVAFVLLGLVSPVSYSVASLIKRVAVIIFAIVWFGNPMTTLQGVGFVLTFLGLYLYDRTSDADKHSRKLRDATKPAPLLPVTTNASYHTASPAHDANLNAAPNGDLKGGAAFHANGVPLSLAPGTKAEATWDERDAHVAGQQPGSALR